MKSELAIGMLGMAFIATLAFCAMPASAQETHVLTIESIDSDTFYLDFADVEIVRSSDGVVVWEGRIYNTTNNERINYYGDYDDSGPTPFSINLTEGSYTIYAKRELFRSSIDHRKGDLILNEPVEVRANKSVSLVLRFVPEDATTPDWAISIASYVYPGGLSYFLAIFSPIFGYTLARFAGVRKYQSKYILLAYAAPSAIALLILWSAATIISSTDLDFDIMYPGMEIWWAFGVWLVTNGIFAFILRREEAIRGTGTSAILTLFAVFGVLGALLMVLSSILIGGTMCYAPMPPEPQRKLIILAMAPILTNKRLHVRAGLMKDGILPPEGARDARKKP